MDQALFQFYDLGIVAENKNPNSKIVLATPVATMGLLDGELQVSDQELTHKGVKADGSNYSVKVMARNAIRCQWLQMGSNRHTAPDVRRGERVLIYRYADSDEFYWISPGLDDHLRRLETVVYLFSGLADANSDEPLSPENSYCLEISTHNKVITLSTSMVNEEVNSYVFQFNTLTGVVTLTDDLENYFQLESQENRMTFKNADESHLVIDKETIDVYTNDWVNITASNSIKVTTQNLTFEVGENVIFDVGGNMNMDIGGSFTATVGGAMGFTASSIKLDSDVTVTGSLSVASLGGADGGALNITSAISSSKGGTFAEAVSGPSNSI